MDQNGELLNVLSLNQFNIPVETYGVPNIVTSLALQR
jgi:hypothetical protein